MLPITVKGNGGFRTENTGKVTLERRPGLARCGGLQPVISVLEKKAEAIDPRCTSSVRSRRDSRRERQPLPHRETLETTRGRKEERELGWTGTQPLIQASGAMDAAWKLQFNGNKIMGGGAVFLSNKNTFM